MTEKKTETRYEIIQSRISKSELEKLNIYSYETKVSISEIIRRELNEIIGE